MKNLTNFWQFLKKPENIVSLVGVLVTVILVILDLKNPSSDLMLPAIVFLLTTLSISQLVANFDAIQNLKPLAEVRDTQTKILSILSKPAGQILQERSTITDRVKFRLAKATEVVIIGRTMRVISSQTDFLQSLLDKECHVRLVVLDPSSQVSKEFENQSALKHNLNQLLDLVQNQANKGKIEIRLINSSLATGLGFIVIDPQLIDSEIIIELAPYKGDSFSRPNIVIQKESEPKWHDYFIQTCNRIWSDSKPITSV
jgi:hypothetical protein